MIKMKKNRVKRKKEVIGFIENNPITKRVKVSKNFYLDEFIDPFTYINERDRGLGKIDYRIVILAQRLRDYWEKPLAINTWWDYFISNECSTSYHTIIKNIEKSNDLIVNGKLQSIRRWSGYRPPHCRIGSKRSAHKVGKAIDPKGPGKLLFRIVRDHPKEFYDLGLRRLEDRFLTPTWLHMDTLERNTTPNTIRVVDLIKTTEIIKW